MQVKGQICPKVKGQQNIPTYKYTYMYTLWSLDQEKIKKFKISVVYPKNVSLLERCPKVDLYTKLYRWDLRNCPA